MSHLHRLLLTVGLLVVMTRPAAANNYVVTNNADFGAGSLRKAINDANANAGADTITFMLPAGSTTITPQSPLPVITAGGLDITGQTGPGGGPVVELDGSSAGASALGLSVLGGPTTIRRLVINRFGDRGIAASNMTGLTVQGCRIGTNVAGDTDLGNAADGILLTNVTTATIGGPNASDGNQISGNGGAGIAIGSTSSGIVMQHNLIGTTADGATALGNAKDGVRVVANANTVGTPGAGNVISGNGGRGVSLEGTGNFARGNFIGLDAGGSNDIGNQQEGILVLAANNTIGGTVLGSLNVVSGNGASGIYLGPNAANTVIKGNYVGTNASGTVAVGNTGTGITVRATGVKVGGSSPSSATPAASS